MSIIHFRNRFYPGMYRGISDINDSAINDSAVNDSAGRPFSGAGALPECRLSKGNALGGTTHHCFKLLSQLLDRFIRKLLTIGSEILLQRKVTGGHLFLLLVQVTLYLFQLFIQPQVSVLDYPAGPFTPAIEFAAQVVLPFVELFQRFHVLLVVRQYALGQLVALKPNQEVEKTSAP